MQELHQVRNLVPLRVVILERPFAPSIARARTRSKVKLNYIVVRFKRDDCVPGDSAAKRQRDDATLDSPRSRKEVAQLLSASLSTNPEPAFLFSPDIEKTESVPFGSSVTSLLRGASSAAASAPFGSSSTSLLKGGSFSTSHSSLFSNSFSVCMCACVCLCVFVYASTNTLPLQCCHIVGRAASGLPRATWSSEFPPEDSTI